MRDERSVMVAVTDVGRDLVARVLPGHVDRVRHLLFEVATAPINGKIVFVAPGATLD